MMYILVVREVPMSRNRSLKTAVALCLAAVLAAGAAAAVKPKIVFKTESWDFGKIKQGQDVSVDFVFTNEGDDVLQIGNVESSCGCTAVLVSDKKVNPGKAGKLQVTFKSAGYSGEVVKYIYVESNDPNARRIQLKVQAAVDVPPQPKIDLSQYTYDAGLIVEGESLETPVVVKNRGELELSFECALPGAAFFAKGKPAAFPIKVAAGKEAEITVRFPLAGRAGFVREFILFKTNDPLRSTISMTLSGYVVTKLQLKQIFEKYKTIIK
ncbi:MAG: hypothetical protein BWX98_01028 [Candidatus Aminicenantes bacterium ADurb.Bin147]|nr:MAG: hypothetical protein BWX98_01028 [Candidatus Aminicenantes bacterium ADurb.Bin147]